MKRLHQSFWAAGLLISAGGIAAADLDHHKERETRYSVQEIPAPDDPACVPGFQRSTYARRLNERAQAAGYEFCYVATGDPAAPYQRSGERAFRWSRQSASTRLPGLSTSTIFTYARDINEFGTAVGWDLDEINLRAARWPLAGGVSEVIAPSTCDQFGGVFITRADGINDRGSIAATDIKIADNGSCGLRWVLKLATGEEIVSPVVGGSIFAINNQNVIVGSSRSNAVKWSPSLGEIVLASGSSSPPQSQALAWNINDRNEVVGYVIHFDENFCVVNTEARYWAANGMERALPGLPGALHSVAYGINRHSKIVGYSQAAGGTCNAYDPSLLRAVILSPQGAVDLNTLIPRSTARDVQLILASAINDRGQIVTRGIRRKEPKSHCPDFVFDPVTEEFVYDSTLVCQSEYSFLLTPQDDH